MTVLPCKLQPSDSKSSALPEESAKGQGVMNICRQIFAWMYLEMTTWSIKHMNKSGPGLHSIRGAACLWSPLPSLTFPKPYCSRCSPLFQKPVLLRKSPTACLSSLPLNSLLHQPPNQLLFFYPIPTNPAICRLSSSGINPAVFKKKTITLSMIQEVILEPGIHWHVLFDQSVWIFSIKFEAWCYPGAY